jgi:hypothetical protein
MFDPNLIKMIFSTKSEGARNYPLPVPPRIAFCSSALGPVWQGSGSSKNGSVSGSSGGVASLVELSRFKKRLAK